jgi:type II secretory pathway component PulF
MTQPIVINNVERQQIIQFLYNFQRAGIMIPDALREMQHLQPKFEDFWKAGAHEAANGHPLSKILTPLFDKATLTAIIAAETAGTLTEVLQDIGTNYEIETVIRNTFKKLLYPIAVVMVTLGVFLFFMIIVIPTLSRSLPGKTEKNLIFQFSDYANSIYLQYGNQIGIGVLVIIAGFVIWLRDPDNRQTVIATLDRVPHVGEAMRDIFHGLWAKHVASSTRAGLTLLDTLRITCEILPRSYQPAIQAIARDATQRGFAVAADPKMQHAGDDRCRLPFFIVNAFRMAEKTGDSEQQFRNAAQALVEQGTCRVNNFVVAANNILMPAGAVLNVMAIMPYFLQIGTSMSSLH